MTYPPDPMYGHTGQSGGRDVCPFCGAQADKTRENPYTTGNAFICGSVINDEIGQYRSPECYENQLSNLRAVAEAAVTLVVTGYGATDLRFALEEAGYLLTPLAEVGTEIAPE